MDTTDLIKAIEAEASKRGIAVDALCARISINRATWQRIKKGTNKPSLGNFMSLQGLLADIRQEPIPETKSNAA